MSTFVKQNNVDYISVSQGYNNAKRGFIYSSTIFKSSAKQYIKENSKSIYNGLVQNKQDILDFGLTFIGEALELDDNSFYITRDGLEKVYNEQYPIHSVVTEGDQQIYINRDSCPIEYLIGKKVSLIPLNINGILAGVVETDNLVNSETLPNAFYTERFTLSSRDFYDFNEDSSQKISFGFANKQHDGSFKIAVPTNRTVSLFDSVIVTADKVWRSIDEVEIADNEIVLSYRFYAKLFDANPRDYYISSNLDEVRHIPPEIGNTFNLKLNDGDGALVSDEFKLVGVSFFVDESLDGSVCNALVNRASFNKMYLNLYPSTMLLQVSSIENLERFTTTLRRDYGVWINNAGLVNRTQENSRGEKTEDASKMTYDMAITIDNASSILISLCSILTIVLILLMINLISFSIANRKKEIGILSAIGASNKDITSIFVLETMIIAAISFVIVFVLIFISVAAFNIAISQKNFFDITFPFLRVDLLTVAISIVAAFCLPLLAALIPICKIIKLKPIDAIRNI